MTARVKMGHDNNAEDTPYATVSYGPLLFVLAIPDTTDANTPDPAAKWKYAFDTSSEKPETEISVERSPMPQRWGWQLDAPLKLVVNGQSFDWNPAMRRGLPVDPVGHDSASPFHPDFIMTQLPPKPVAAETAPERISLIPYGCTKFRVSMFPVTERAFKVLDKNKTATAKE
jgi:hypothetical protein